jgi:hypothetical protein
MVGAGHRRGDQEADWIAPLRLGLGGGKLSEIIDCLLVHALRSLKASWPGTHTGTRFARLTTSVPLAQFQINV